MTAVLRFHLATVVRPRLLVLLAALAALTWVLYRPGGPELGAEILPQNVLRIWETVTPFVMVGLAVVTGGPALRYRGRGMVGWAVVGPGWWRAAGDAIVRLACLLAPLAVAGLGWVAFVSSRASSSSVDPGDLVLTFLLGPFAGAVAVFALAELARSLTGSEAARVALVGVLVFMDVVRLLPSAWLSPSGVALEIRHAGLWGPVQLDPVMHAPIEIAPAASFVLARVSLVLIGILIAAWLGARHAAAAKG